MSAGVNGMLGMDTEEVLRHSDAREREDEFADEFTVEDLRQAQRDAGVR